MTSPAGQGATGENETTVRRGAENNDEDERDTGSARSSSRDDDDSEDTGSARTGSSRDDDKDDGETPRSGPRDDDDDDDEDDGDEDSSSRSGSSEATGSGYSPPTSSADVTSLAVDVALAADVAGVRNAVVSSEFLGILADIANTAIDLELPDFTDSISGESADSISDKMRDTVGFCEAVEEDAIAALYTISERLIPALSGQEPPSSPADAVLAQGAPGTVDEVTRAIYLTDVTSVFKSLWLIEAGESGVAARSGRLDESGPGGDADANARAFAASAAETLTSSAAPALAPTSLTSAPMMAQPMGMGMAQPTMGQPMMAQPMGMGGMPSWLSSGSAIPSQAYGARPVSMPSAMYGSGGSAPVGAGSGITASDVRQMVERAKADVARERGSSRPESSSSSRPSGGGSSSSPSVSRSPIPNSTAPTQGSPAVEATGRASAAGPTFGRTVSGGISIAPDQASGRIGVATGLSGAMPDSSGGSGSGQPAGRGGMGGMMPMGAMGAMGNAARGAGAGAGDTANAPGPTTTDPLITGNWASSVGLGGAVVSLGGSLNVGGSDTDIDDERGKAAKW